MMQSTFSQLRLLLGTLGRLYVHPQFQIVDENFTFLGHTGCILLMTRTAPKPKAKLSELNGEVAGDLFYFLLRAYPLDLSGDVLR